MKKTIDLSLYFIADHELAGDRDLKVIIEQAILGGATVIQLREKHMPAGSFIEWARTIKRITSKFGIPLIINDRVDVALAADADGVHLGQEDMPAALARRLLGRRKIIGISTHTLKEARTAEKAGADYLGVGTVFPTGSKKNIPGLLGIEGLRRIRKSIKLPVVAIGGIDAQNISEVIAMGVSGVAVIAAVMRSANPRQTCEILRSVIQKYKLEQKRG